MRLLSLVAVFAGLCLFPDTRVAQANDKGPGAPATGAVKAECGGSVPDDPMTAVDESKLYECFVDVLKNCMDDFGFFGKEAKRLFDSGCIYFIADKEAKAAGLDRLLDGKGVDGLFVDYRGAFLVRFRATGFGHLAEDQDWKKKSTTIHESVHAWQYRNRHFDVLRAKYKEGVPPTFPPGKGPPSIHDCWSAYCEIQACTFQIETLKAKFAATPGADQPSHLALARLIAGALAYLRYNTEKLCEQEDGLQNMPATNSFRTLMESCKAERKSLYGTMKTYVEVELNVGVSIPDWV